LVILVSFVILFLVHGLDLLSFPPHPLTELHLGDRYQAHGEVIIAALLISTITNTATLYMHSFAALLAAVLLTSVFRAPLSPQIDAMVISSLEDKTTYGSLRLWGAVSFGIFSLFGGILASSKPITISGHTADNPFVYLFYIAGLASLFSGFIILSILLDQHHMLPKISLTLPILHKKKASPSEVEMTTLGLSPGAKFRSGNGEENHIIVTDHDNGTLLSGAQSYPVSSVTSILSGDSHTMVGSSVVHNTLMHTISEGGDTAVAPGTGTVNGTTRTATGAVPVDSNTQKPLYCIEDQQEEEGDEDEINGQQLAAVEQHQAPAQKELVWTLLKLVYSNPSILLFGLVVFLSGFGAGVIDSYLFLHLKDLGGSGLVMGLARFITCAAEVPMFHVAGTLQAKYGTWPMIAVTQCAFVVRFVYYVLLRDPWAVLPAEALNGLTFAVTWSVSCTYASQIAPPGSEAMMQALLEGLHFGIGAAMGSLVGGFVYESIGAVHLFEFCGGLSCFSALLAVLACYFVDNDAVVQKQHSAHEVATNNLDSAYLKLGQLDSTIHDEP
jgi:hypothetical protein